jgi:hypothetical protein
MILTPRQIAQIDRSVSYVGGSKFTVNDLLDTVEMLLRERDNLYLERIRAMCSDS